MLIGTAHIHVHVKLIVVESWIADWTQQTRDLVVVDLVVRQCDLDRRHTVAVLSNLLPPRKTLPSNRLMPPRSASVQTAAHRVRLAGARLS